MNRVLIGIPLGLVWALSAPPVAGALEITPAAWQRGDWIDVTISGAPPLLPDSVALVGPARIQGEELCAIPAGLACRFDLRAAPVGWYDLLLIASGGEMHVEPGCFEVLEITMPEKWSAPERLTAEPEISSHPDIAVDIFGQAHVVWQNKQPAVDKHNILYRAWDGVLWSTPQLVNPGG